jgi:hypothetical protein
MRQVQSFDHTVAQATASRRSFLGNFLIFGIGIEDDSSVFLICQSVVKDCQSVIPVSIG